MNVMMWEHCTSDCEIFDVKKFTTLTPLLLLISSKVSFPSVIHLPTFAMKYPNIAHTYVMKKQEYFHSLSKHYLHNYQ
jgi:hypothetical protein